MLPWLGGDKHFETIVAVENDKLVIDSDICSCLVRTITFHDKHVKNVIKRRKLVIHSMFLSGFLIIKLNKTPDVNKLVTWH